MKSTAIANSNIAFVKYWGKKDYELNLPMNPSISMTLDKNLSTITTVDFSKEYKEDIFFLNDKKQSGEKLERVSWFLDLIRAKAHSRLKAKVYSINTFPTGSGIASSASGFAALAAASTKALELNLSKKELSSLARQGSGSASRSIFGGFVFWDNESSKQIYDENYWPELRDMIIIVENKEKKISSRQGMKLTSETSKLYSKRIKNIKTTIEKVKKALLEKNFESLMNLVMQDSDNMHECIHDTTPKLEYLNKKSYEIIKIINLLNKKKIIAGYSFDAGPNAHIITLDKFLPILKKELNKISESIIISKPGEGITYSKNHFF
jgi:diphosphomevalonate decarboxylase